MTDKDDPTGMARLLAGLRETGPMPEDLVQRIRTSLDEEQVAREDDPEQVPAGDGPGTDDTTGDDPGGAADGARKDTPFWEGLAGTEESDGTAPTGARRRTGRLVLAGAAALVAVAAVGSLAVDQFRDGGQAASGEAGAGRSAASSPATSDARPSGEQAPFVITSTGTDYTQEDFGQQAAPLLDGPGEIKGEPDEELVGTMSTAAGAQDCLTRLGHPELLPVAVDIATFEGRPGLAIVAELPPDGQAKAFAVTKGCEPIWEGPTEVEGG